MPQVGNWIEAVGRIFRQQQPVVGSAYQDRQWSYLLYEAYYNNTVYNTILNGGQRENLNAQLGNAQAADLAGLYNPIRRCCDFYQHVFGGEFGVDIVLDPTRSRPAISDPLKQIWTWSAMNQQKQVLCRLAAIHGVVGLRVKVRPDPDPARRRIYLKVEHPSIIRDVDVDDRGNVQSIELEYDLVLGLGDAQKVIRIRELQTKTTFATWRVVADGRTTVPYDLDTNTDNGPNSSYPNALGVVPYVILSHQPSGETWSSNAYAHVLPLIDRLNALATHLNVQIHRHVRVKWFIAATGTAPTEIDLGDLSVAYVNLQNSTGTPLVQPLVAPLNLADTIKQTQVLLQEIGDALPELKATGGEFLSNMSGQTVAELRKPAEDRLALARVNYEDALIRWQKLALSMGILHGFWDIGTGMGTREAAQRAYDQGFETHFFNARPLFLDSTLPPAQAMAAPGAAVPASTQPLVPVVPDATQVNGNGQVAA